jgi:hypothetical protein
MSALVLAPASIDTAEIILDAHALYRRSQDPFRVPLPADGAGDLFKAQDRLWLLLEPHTRTDNRRPVSEPDAEGIEDAADALVAAIEWHCGDAAATWVAGIEGGEAA